LISLNVLIFLGPELKIAVKIAASRTGNAGIFRDFMPFLCVQIKGFQGGSLLRFILLIEYKKSFPHFLDKSRKRENVSWKL
jgi:hypothetical protein